MINPRVWIGNVCLLKAKRITYGHAHIKYGETVPVTIRHCVVSLSEYFIYLFDIHLNLMNYTLTMCIFAIIIFYVCLAAA
jgi:hypothetical protein